MEADTLNSLSREIIEAAIDVHYELGPGLLESAYRKCLAIRLVEMGHSVKEELFLPLTFHGHIIEEKAFRLDLLIDNLVVVELKSVEDMRPLYTKQLGTYLKLANLRLGLLINFNVPLLRDGIQRVVNKFPD